MRLRHIGTIATTILLFGVAVASADARVSNGAASGGAEAPAGDTGGTGVGAGTGPTGTTGDTGTSGVTGATGTTGTIVPPSDLAPIVLARGQSPSAVYSGPIFELTPAGLVPYTPPPPPPPSPTSSNSLAGGAVAVASSNAEAVASSNDITALPELEVPGNTAEEIDVDGLGLAAAPENAPAIVQDIIWAANEIIGRPYVFGGGHKSFTSAGYDCSGLVSFALHGGDLLARPLDSGQFMRWGTPGQGVWMTILTNPGHAYLDIAGLRLDTSSANDPTGLQGSHWRPLRPYNFGFLKRHPVGL